MSIQKIIIVCCSLLVFLSCRQATQKFDNQGVYSPKNQQQSERKTENGKKIPQKVYEVLRFVKENGRAMDGYVGGRKFGNYEKRLPIKEAGRKIQYQEWDVNPKRQGKNRGVERLITGSNDKAYFTKDHYDTFVEVEDLGLRD
jgi:ribonuclease T1